MYLTVKTMLVDTTVTEMNLDYIFLGGTLFLDGLYIATGSVVQRVKSAISTLK